MTHPWNSHTAPKLLLGLATEKPALPPTLSREIHKESDFVMDLKEIDINDLNNKFRKARRKQAQNENTSHVKI